MNPERPGARRSRAGRGRGFADAVRLDTAASCVPRRMIVLRRCVSEVTLTVRSLRRSRAGSGTSRPVRPTRVRLQRSSGSVGLGACPVPPVRSSIASCRVPQTCAEATIRLSAHRFAGHPLRWGAAVGCRLAVPPVHGSPAVRTERRVSIARSLARTERPAAPPVSGKAHAIRPMCWVPRISLDDAPLEPCTGRAHL